MSQDIAHDKSLTELIAEYRETAVHAGSTDPNESISPCAFKCAVREAWTGSLPLAIAARDCSHTLPLH